MRQGELISRAAYNERRFAEKLKSINDERDAAIKLLEKYASYVERCGTWSGESDELKKRAEKLLGRKVV